MAVGSTSRFHLPPGVFQQGFSGVQWKIPTNPITHRNWGHGFMEPLRFVEPLKPSSSEVWWAIGSLRNFNYNWGLHLRLAYGCFPKWWVSPHFTPQKWWFLVGKPVVVEETHHLRKDPYTLTIHVGTVNLYVIHKRVGALVPLGHHSPMEFLDYTPED